ncbi:MAG: hypothetical protein WA949_21105 [Phormidesmis sp.]
MSSSNSIALCSIDRARTGYRGARSQRDTSYTSPGAITRCDYKMR